MCSLTFDWRNSKSGLPVSVPTLSREPVMKLSSASTRMPRFSRASHRCEPMKPAPPETTALCLLLVAADTPIRETEIAHDLRVVDVAPVDDYGPAHRGFDAAKVESAELVPLRDNNQRVGARREVIRISRVLDLGQLDSRTFHRGGIVGPNLRAGSEQHPRDIDARGLTEVIGVGFESEAEEADDSVVQALEAFAKLVDDEHPLVAVDVHDGVEQLGVVVEALGQRRERLHILGKTSTSLAQTHVEVARTDALVHPHTFRDELRIRSHSL